MNSCCVKYKVGAISAIHYCSADLWNSTLNFSIDGYKIIKFCPECGTLVNSSKTIKGLLKFRENALSHIIKRQTVENNE